MDKIANLQGSLVHYGQDSNRVYVMKYKPNLELVSHQEHILHFKEFAKKNNYDKIMVKAPVDLENIFLDLGYTKEACIPFYKLGTESYGFFAYYLSDRRSMITNEACLRDVVEVAKNKKREDTHSKYEVHVLTEADIGSMVQLYKKVFPTYPFPIYDPEYILQTMNDEVIYFGIKEDEKLIATASCEMDIGYKNVEMTDFATDPARQGSGFGKTLLDYMETHMKKMGIITAYTICRGVSYGINIVFAKSGYTFSGQLINNTNISGKIESMNIWHKQLS